MLNSRKLRRNDIVMERDAGGHWSPYGRVWRRHDNDHVEVIDCTKHVTVYHEDELALVEDYKGFWTPSRTVYDRGPDGQTLYHTGRMTEPRFIRMASLRQLKRKASRYQPHFGGRRQYSRKDRAEALANPCHHAAG